MKRHLPVNNHLDTLSPFTVGNGEFAFTVDPTGLQTLFGHYEAGIPLLTQSQWGWHSNTDNSGFRPEETWQLYDTYGREVPYASAMDSDPARYLRSNPHRLNLGRVGFMQDLPLPAEIPPGEISGIQQVLDLWEGIIHSSFKYMGQSLEVLTCAHPELDQIAVIIESPGLGETNLGIGFNFPFGSDLWGKTASNWNQPSRHVSAISDQGENYVILSRQMDSTQYIVEIGWKGKAQFARRGDHGFILSIGESKRFEFTVRFIQDREQAEVGNAKTFEASKRYWERFWRTGGAVDLSGSTDPRAMELERRIVLSQYLTAIQCNGSIPPQETGLTFNSWFGKFHLEMHWWHAVHFVLWGHPEMMEKSLAWYQSILPVAREKAVLQGYEGVRWPKMTSPDGHDSPSGVGVFLIWQQPHPIYLAELLYRTRPSNELLEKYSEMVFETAEFMASYAHWEEEGNRYVLGPPLIPAQEIYAPASTMNPAFELSYWAFGLITAQRWRERMGLQRDEKWDHVIDHLAPLPSASGYYQNAETALNTFQEGFHRNDHPTLLGAFGMLPNEDIDVEMMQRTLKKVMQSWNWERTWGWDYPLTAMTAARVGLPALAIDALLMEVEKNTYLNNGHNFQSERLPVYLPGNGGLLTAVAMMSAGWDGAPDIHAPGFPRDGTWNVKFEGLYPLP